MLRISKLVSCIIVIILLAILISSCGSKVPTKAPEPTVAPATSTVEQAPPTEKPAENPTQVPETEKPAGEVVVAFGFSSVTTDFGWTMSHDLGRQAVEKKFPQVKTIYVEAMPFSEEASRTLEQFIADGAKLIIIAAEYGEFIYKVAEANPDVMFFEANGSQQFDNVSTYYYANGLGEYLLGMAAGLLTESNKLGFVTSFPIPINYTSANAFHLGARSVNPDVETNVILINSWYDPAAHRLAAETLIDGGADVIYSNLDDPSAIQVGEEKGVWIGTAFTERSQFGPNAYLNSTVTDWGYLYTAEVEALLNGAWEGNRIVISTLGEVVDLGEWGQNVPQDVRDQVEIVHQQILDGSMYPFVGPIYNADGELVIPEGEEISLEFMRTDWVWPVEGVSGLE
ncbi:MAG: BMP family ABC transporter substrate-binding protein [Anaerolineales bacterium]|nr:BMP family ABC transporter substrate-binding protein [Anaerolineales bacterium]